MLYLLIILLFLITLIYFYKKRDLSPNEVIGYYRKKYLVTKPEQLFFQLLTTHFGKDYTIVPQVNISKFIGVNHDRNYYRNFYSINQKSIDFLICSPKYLNPLLAIELNDSSHSKPERIKRDEFITALFDSIHMPLLFVPLNSMHDPDLIIKIKEILNHSDHLEI